MVRVNVTVN